MKKQITLNKITPDVRNQISSLMLSLPEVPFFLSGKDGMIVQRMATGKLISGAQLIEEDGKLKDGSKIHASNTYIQRGQKVRMMNHKVTLTEQFQKLGQKGIDDYCDYVKQLAIVIENMKKNPAPKGLTQAPAGPPISEEEGKEIMEGIAHDDEILKAGEPKPEDFGYSEIDVTEDGVQGLKGVWSVEGGESAYNKALAEYQEANELK